METFEEYRSKLDNGFTRVFAIRRKWRLRNLFTRRQEEFLFSKSSSPKLPRGWELGKLVTTIAATPWKLDANFAPPPPKTYAEIQASVRDELRVRR